MLQVHDPLISRGSERLNRLIDKFQLFRTYFAFEETLGRSLTTIVPLVVRIDLMH